MSRFPTAAHLASWAGVCPGHHESAGRRKSSARRHGNRYLGAALGTAARSIARSDNYLGARYRRLSRRLKPNQVNVAIQHSMITAIWHMLTNDLDYQDLGGDYFLRRNPEQALRGLIRQANTLGYTVRFDPIQAA